jgi:8-oxo-dGTP pyrophosphatase MutT (NUDIX family)
VAFRGAFLRVEVETWPWGEREIVRHPGACAVVARTPSGQVVLVRQFREAPRRSLLELPAGVLDVAGEEPEACAARELFEETGYRATDVRPLGTVLTSPGFADERIELFGARTAGDRPEGDGEAEIEVVRMGFDAAIGAVRDGRIVDAKTACGLLLAAQVERPAG